MLAHLHQMASALLARIQRSKPVLVVLLGSTSLLATEAWAGPPGDDFQGLSYTNQTVPEVPWSIHLVRLDRDETRYQVQSFHATGQAIGLETLSELLASVLPAAGTPVAAINGDFYARDKAYAGAPRGLQVVNGELLSAPSGSASFWLDALGQPHATNVTSRFEVGWPGGHVTPFGLNGERAEAGVELYTPALGSSTHTVGGREFMLERNEGSPWLPLRLGQTYAARVVQVREKGDTPVKPGFLVLSVGSTAARSLPIVQTGAVLRISTASLPALHGVRTALSGGPVLVRAGRRQNSLAADSQAYEFTSRQERHPRSAFGWNQSSFFMVEVDGRQKGLSAGMTLDELSNLLVKLGCQEAINLDGGGSATLWYAGSVRNSPCDRAERDIANCLVVVKTADPLQKRADGIAR